MKNTDYNKYKHIIGLILTMVFLNSCLSDILEEDPRSQLPLGVVDGKSLIVDTYDQMADLASQRHWYLMTESATDNMNFVGSNARRRQFMSSRVDPGNNELKDSWDVHYGGIASANTVISKIDSSKVSEDERIRIQGEALFLRALNYFNLVRFFGDIPLPLTPAQSGEEVKQRVPAKQIYDQIIIDLKFAESVLPQNYIGLNEGRATVHAARALLSKVFLTRASIKKYNPFHDVGGSLSEYDSAKVYLQKLQNANFALTPIYSDNFNILTEYNSEVVFDIKCFADGPYKNKNRGPADWAANPNLYGGNTYNQVSITKDLYELFDENDDRLGLIVRGQYTTTTGQTFETRLYTRDGDSSYGNLIFSWKFLDSQNPAADGGVGQGFQLGGVNYPLIRYADVLLMLAEAEYETGNTDNALMLINQVRTRAGVENISDVSIETVMDERRRELYLEGHRWFDLVRTGMLKERVETAALKEGPLIHYDASVEVDLPKEYLYPIPQREIDLGLTQNPGY